jgi:hypothetical protein
MAWEPWKNLLQGEHSVPKKKNLNATMPLDIVYSLLTTKKLRNLHYARLEQD